ncbi:LysM peptidoglycan-binding domain-containing protein [Halioglobus sp.]|nr:LysM peptidoglycan-binding domain-containing protein [Halioglobus sp.]
MTYRDIVIFISKLKRLSITFYIIAFLGACETVSTRDAATVGTEQGTASTSNGAAEHPVADDIPPDDLWVRIRSGLAWQDIDNPRVARQRQALLAQSNYMPLVSERANYYLFYIVEEIDQRDMPLEIALIPVIESMLDPKASSYSGAAGLWQIMPRTGQHLGIEQNNWYDGRHAVRDSTAGALDYLQMLHDRFDDDWLLALAAYNAGRGTVLRAQKVNVSANQPTDYWSLRLRQQAYEYVPKLIALSQIVASPEKYGVNIPPVPNRPSFEVADPGLPLNLAHAAELAEIDVAILHALNPGQLRGTIAPYRSTELLLPYGSSQRFQSNLEKVSPAEITQWHEYRVKPGDTLWDIARSFGTDVALLRSENGIKGSTIRAGQTLTITGFNPARGQPPLPGPDTKAQGYLVRAGDSLSLIANRFQISVGNIIAWNELDPDDYLRPGQKLTLYLGGG